MSDSPDNLPGPPVPDEAGDAWLEPGETNSDRLEPAADDFVPESIGPPGPGLGEALAWTIGTLVVHVIASLSFYMYCSAQELEREGIPQDRWMQTRAEREFIEKIQSSHMATMVAGEQAVFLAVVLLFAWLRLSTSRTRALPLRKPAGSHVALIALWVLPLAVFCGQLGVIVTHGWNWLIDWMPALKALDNETVMQTVSKLRESISPAQLIVWIAIFPAISEELVFRGVVGRGLVARYGLVAGIGITSVLFAAVHLHPVHAIALLPLAVAIHVSYLATRSFLVPVLLHFLNNSWAVVALFHQDSVEQAKEAVNPLLEDQLPADLALAAGACSLCIGMAIWQTRIVFRNSAGEVWNPHSILPDVPSEDSDYRPVKLRSSAAVVAACWASVLLFWGLLFYNGALKADEMQKNGGEDTKPGAVVVEGTVARASLLECSSAAI